MAQPVWVLSVDLQTKTATFQSGMADAARAARGSFSEIKSGAAEMTRETGGSMMEARHGVMLLGEEFGVHLPRGITTFIASLGPVASVMEAAFPFLAVIVGATLLLEHLAKMKEAGAKTAGEWGHIDTEATKALSKMGDKLLEVEIQSDRLSGNSLAALHKQLILIDHQSMSELESTFDVLASKIDTVLKAGSRGTLMSTLIGEGAGNKVKAEFDKFKDQYTALLSEHKDTEARGVLVDEIIHAQEQLKKYQAMPQTNSWVREAVGDYARLITQLENVNRLQDESSEIASKKKGNLEAEHVADLHPELFVDAENKKRVSLAQTIALIKKQQEAANEAAKLQLEGVKGLEKGLQELREEHAKLAEEAGKEDAGHGLRMAKLQLEADKEAGKLLVTNKREIAQQMMAADIAAADRAYEIQRDAYAKEIDALDKYGKDYENKLRALQNKQTELTRAHENEVTRIQTQAVLERNGRVLSAEEHMRDALASGLTSVLMRQESLAKAMIGLGDQIAAGMIQNALKSIAALDMTKERQAAAAARDGWLAGMKFPWPANLAMAPALAAAHFASVMAFEGGGIVPGHGVGDTVPAMLTPGEAVLPKQMTERLTKASDSGNSGPDVHFHHYQTNHIHAIDGASVRGMLEKHSSEFEQHVTNHIRKMNR